MTYTFHFDYATKNYWRYKRQDAGEREVNKLWYLPIGKGAPPETITISITVPGTQEALAL